jgi:3-hydroxy-9,10-secoandrosta-1,3,5(10)-triene-9,17-dione monooxygenase
MTDVAKTDRPTTPEVPAPEPDLTAAEVIRRAERIKPLVREQQDESERRGYHSEELHQEFLRAGFYRMLQPRLFGGYELDFPTFWRVITTISEGDPGTGWCLALATHHAWVIASHWPAQGQRELFGPAGDFRGPHRALPGGTATPVEGGYRVMGQWDYCSGVPYSTHFMGNCVVPASERGGEPRMAIAVVPRDGYTMLDDWGGGSQLGLQSSGSNSVRVEDVLVPSLHVVEAAPGWTTRGGPTPGTELHGNPMYLGAIAGPYHAGLVCCVVGAAKAALEDFEESITTKKTAFPPQVMRYQHPDYLRTWGMARAMADSAEQLLYRVGEQYMELCQLWADTGRPFTRDDDLRLWAILQQAGRLACETVELLFRSGGSTQARRGQRMQRYFRDVSMYRGHIAAQYLNLTTEFARLHFGLPVSLPL